LEGLVEGLSPSSLAKVSTFKNVQDSDENYLLIGRPGWHREGLPIGLYNPIFDRFSAALKTEPDEIDFRNPRHRIASELCASATQIYASELERWNAIKPKLQLLLHGRIEDNVKADPSKKSTGKTSTGRAAADGVIRSEAAGHKFFHAIFELKSEIGTGGSDPSVQGAFSYRNYYSQRKVCDSIVLFFKKTHRLTRMLRLSSFITARVSSSHLLARGFVSLARCSSYDQLYNR
jgi:hypothetical protein